MCVLCNVLYCLLWSSYTCDTPLLQFHLCLPSICVRVITTTFCRPYSDTCETSAAGIVVTSTEEDSVLSSLFVCLPVIDGFSCNVRTVETI